MSEHESLGGNTMSSRMNTTSNGSSQAGSDYEGGMAMYA